MNSEARSRSVTMHVRIAFAVLACAGIASAGNARAAGANGWYTPQQAQQGQQYFNNYCAQCHRPDLTGAAGPALTGDAALERFVAGLNEQYGWMRPNVLRRMAWAYGSRVRAVLGSASRLGHLGEPIADGLYEAELEYLAAREWARSADDVLWRRSKLGLHLSAEQQRRVADWFQRRVPTAGLEAQLGQR